MPEQAIQLIIALATGGVLTSFGKGLFGWLTGRHVREQSAWQQRDHEAKTRRMLEEYAGTLRRALLDNGVSREDLPDWPDYKN